MVLPGALCSCRMTPRIESVPFDSSQMTRMVADRVDVAALSVATA